MRNARPSFLNLTQIRKTKGSKMKIPLYLVDIAKAQKMEQHMNAQARPDSRYLNMKKNVHNEKNTSIISFFASVAKHEISGMNMKIKAEK